MTRRITTLTAEQRARFDEWADRWIDVGLSTDPADRPRFTDGARRCYAAADIPWPDNTVWIPNPLVGALAAPAAAVAIELIRRRRPGAVDGAVRGAWYRYIGGQFWVGSWWWGPAWTSFFRDVCGLELDGDLWDRARAYEDTVESACWWFPYRDFVMVSERPHTIRLEQVGPRGLGSHRLHCDSGPAIGWDGYELYFWHGVQVPAWVVHSPTPHKIIGEENVEVRRCGIEAYGWDRFVADAQLKLVDTADDPGNPGQTISLFDVPAQLWGDEVRVLLVTNGSTERDGTRRRYGLTTPADVPDAVSAAAWTYDLPRAVYAGMSRRT